MKEIISKKIKDIIEKILAICAFVKNIFKKLLTKAKSML